MLKIEKDDEDEKYSVVQLMEGRHVVFLSFCRIINHYQLPSEDGAIVSRNKPDGISQALVLSRNGGAIVTLHYCKWQRKGVGGRWCIKVIMASGKKALGFLADPSWGRRFLSRFQERRLYL